MLFITQSSQMCPSYQLPPDCPAAHRSTGSGVGGKKLVFSMSGPMASSFPMAFHVNPYNHLLWKPEVPSSQSANGPKSMAGVCHSHSTLHQSDS